MDLKQGWQSFKESREFREFYFFAVALILAFGTLQTTGTVMNTDKPVVTVVSCSMYPHYDVGDIILVQGKEFENIREGDIAVYNSRQQDMTIPVIHRVTAKHDDYLETQGDNNNRQLEFEKKVEPEQIHGVAVGSIPRLGMVKIATIDLLGLSGPNDSFMMFDSIPDCNVRV